MPDAASVARGVYQPRRPQASPLFRLVSDHLHRPHRLQTVYDDRFAREYGPWRPVVAQVADKFLACGVLDHGFVRLELFDEDQAAGMLTWPHSGFHVHTAVWVPEDDRAFATRLARYYARNPVALERLTYERTAKAVTYRSDKSDGLTAMVAAPRLAPTEATRRWAALLQQLFEVDPLACPTCHGAMRIVAFITQTSVIDQILAHLRTRSAREAHAGPRSPPSTRASASWGQSRAPRPSAEAPTTP